MTTTYPNEQDIQIVPGRQYMVRRFADSRRVRVEIDSVMSFAEYGHCTVFGRYVKRDKYHPRSIVVGNRRAWSTEPQFIEEVDQI